VLVYRGEEACALVLGLQPGGRYRFRVQACNKLGSGPWGDWAELCTPPDVPAAPLPPALSSPAAATSLKLAWKACDARGSPITSYVVQAAMQGQVSCRGHLIPQSTFMNNVSLGSTSPLLSPTSVAVTTAPASPSLAGGRSSDGPLVPNGDTASVVSVATTGSSSPAAVLAVLQQQPAVPPSPLTSMSPTKPPLAATTTAKRSSSSSSNGVDASTAAAAAAAAAATASLQLGPWQDTYRGAELSTEMTGLRPSSRYLVRVAACNAQGQGPWSPIAAMTTAPAPPSPPCGLTAHATGQDRVALTWAPPAIDNGSPLQGYVIEALGRFAVAHASSPPAAGARATPNGSSTGRATAAAAADSANGGIQGSGGVSTQQGQQQQPLVWQQVASTGLDEMRTEVSESVCLLVCLLAGLFACAVVVFCAAFTFIKPLR
jgi:hypothetical protein